METSDKVASHLHAVASFDLADHPMPNGREEVWRFTPLKRLRGALDDAPTQDDESGAAATYEVRAGDEVVLGTLAPGEAPRGLGLVPVVRSQPGTFRPRADLAGRLRLRATYELSYGTDWKL